MANKKESGKMDHGAQVTSDEYLGNLITVFEPVLLKNLRVSHLLCLLDIEEVKKVSAAIHKTENFGNFEKACKDLLEAIRKGKEPGKWRMFIDALNEMNESAALSVLLEEQEEQRSEWLSALQNNRLIEIFSRSIEDHLNLASLLPAMYQEKLITPVEMENLLAQIQGGNPRDANFCFLLYVHRHHKNWYKVFMEILFKDEHHKELVKEIDEEEYEKLKKKHGITDDELMQEEATSLETPAEGDRSSGGHKRTTNLSSLTQKDVGDKSLPHISRKHHSDRVGPKEATDSSTASCGCGCCLRVMAELSEMRTLVSSLPELKTQIASLTSELQDMKDLLLKALKSK